MIEQVLMWNLADALAESWRGVPCGLACCDKILVLFAVQSVQGQYCWVCRVHMADAAEMD